MKSRRVSDRCAEAFQKAAESSQVVTVSKQSALKHLSKKARRKIGGFFEHVAPPRVVAPNNVDTDLVNGAALLGFRVPIVIASPFTLGGGVNSGLYDHTATLKLIEWRWGLQPLTASGRLVSH